MSPLGEAVRPVSTWWSGSANARSSMPSPPTVQWLCTMSLAIWGRRSAIMSNYPSGRGTPCSSTRAERRTAPRHLHERRGVVSSVGQVGHHRLGRRSWPCDMVEHGVRVTLYHCCRGTCVRAACSGHLAELSRLRHAGRLEWRCRLCELRKPVQRPDLPWHHPQHPAVCHDDNASLCGDRPVPCHHAE